MKVKETCTGDCCRCFFTVSVSISIGASIIPEEEGEVEKEEEVLGGSRISEVSEMTFEIASKTASGMTLEIVSENVLETSGKFSTSGISSGKTFVIIDSGLFGFWNWEGEAVGGARVASGGV